MSHDDKYDEGIADIKEQIRQIEANQAEDFDGSCTAVIIDLPHAKAILAQLSTQSKRRDTTPSEEQIAAAQEHIGCLSDEQCTNGHDFHRCSHCKDATRSALAAAMQLAANHDTKEPK